MESGGGGLFMKLAPELLLVFLNYLYLHDIAKLRCVSKWFDERICSLMPSKFRSFKIRLSRESCESILRAMEKPNGHLNLLNIEIGNCKGQTYRLKEILNDYKDNISTLDLRYWKNLSSDMVSFLQHEDTLFPLLEKLSMKLDNLHVINLLKKHAEQLTYLKLSYARKNPHNYPHFPKLETLIVDHIHPDDLVSLLSLCSESLSTLRIRFMYKERRPVLQQLPELPKLQTLDLYNFSLGETVKSLISKCRQTLTGIVFDEIRYEFEMEDKYFPKLKYMKFKNVYDVDVMQDMISVNACQLSTLILYQVHDLILPNTLSNIKNLFIHDCQNLANILKCASSLQCLVISQPYVFDDLKDIEKMPNLTDFYLLNIHTCYRFMKSIKHFLVKNADTLEFLVLHFNYSSNTEFETMESTPPPVELNKVHTLIILQKKTLSESEREFFKALCPNAQIMIKNGEGGEYIQEIVKLRLKYNKADDLFCQYDL